MNYKEKGLSEQISEFIDLGKVVNSQIEGLYIGAREFEGKKAGQITTLHAFKINDKMIGVWGSKDLNEKLKGEDHKNVKVKFKEKRNLGNGHTFKVFEVLVEDK